MSEEAIYKTSRARAYFFKVLRNIVVVIGGLAFVYFSPPEQPGASMTLYWSLVAFISCMLVIALSVLWNSKVPFAVYPSKVTVSYSLTVPFPRKSITGVGIHPKTKKPCLIYEDDKPEYGGMLQIPWHKIHENEAEVMAVLEREFGAA